MNRRQNFQTIAWFWDLYDRQLLNLDPPYQRRSVWNQNYRDYFIDTILLQYPAPAIFLYEEIDEAGRAKYNVVDGKQRLTTLFSFINNEFPVADNAQLSSFRGRYFKDLDRAIKTQFWSYEFSVEYLPTDDESIINNVFDRINKNVAKLTPQELRHAKFDGKFITSAESLSEWMETQLPSNFPNITTTYRNKMKDVELTAQLILLIEEGPKGYSQLELDEAFSKRDLEWEEQHTVETTFRQVVNSIKALLEEPAGQPLPRLRLRNQTDFYSLFGALASSTDEHPLPPSDVIATRLVDFLTAVDDAGKRSQYPDALKYYEATRTAPNLTAPRKERIDIIRRCIFGETVLSNSDDNSATNSQQA